MNRPSHLDISQQVKRALEEDLGGNIDIENDITACLIEANTNATAKVITREDCTVCGVDWVNQTFAQIDDSLKITWFVKDGDSAPAESVLFTVTGNARAILTAERTALNFLQTLSGTATTTAKYAALLAHSDTEILDTRKTLPGMRLAQKYAVLCGGGKNHRIGLFDAFLIKENHIAACGSIPNAISKAKQLHPEKPVEVEVESLDELRQAIDGKADIVMLDNFDNEQIQQAVDINQGRCKLEVSGNITEERLFSLANLGVNYVSSGALTKHIKAVDLSLRLSIND